MSQESIVVDDDTRSGRVAGTWGIWFRTWASFEFQFQLLFGSGCCGGHVEFELRLGWFVDLGLGLFEFFVEDFLCWSVGNDMVQSIDAHLKLQREIVDIASVFVVDAGILPDQTE